MAKDAKFYIDEVGVLDWLAKNDEKQYIRFKDRIEHRFKGKIHSLIGPAVIWLDNVEEFWIHGEKFDNKESWEKIAKVKLRHKKIKKIL